MRLAVRHAAIFTATLLASACSAFAQQEVPEVVARKQGLTMYVYEVDTRPTQLQLLVPGQTPNVSRYIDTFDLKTAQDFGNPRGNFTSTVFGWVTIEKAGKYEFALNNDDGAELLVDNGRVILADGANNGKDASTGVVELSAGVHTIRVNHYDSGGDQLIRVQWKVPGSTEFVTIPKESLFTNANVVHVTSPGKKQLIAPLADTRPGDGQPLEAVHPSFTLSDLHHDGFQPRVGGIDTLPDGRIVVTTWDANGDCLFVDPKTKEVKRFATGLAEPLGVKVVDGEVYVLQKQELTHLIDHDKDGVADEYRCVSNVWPVTGNFHEFAFGLVYKDGFFYANLAVAIDPGGRTTSPQIAPDPVTGVGRGQCIQIDAKTGAVKPIAQGLRAPNGITMLSNGDLYVTDNQGDWLPSSKLLKIKEGGFYNQHLNPDHVWASKPVVPPVAWLPQGEIGNSPGNPLECKVGPWKGQILHSDVTHGGIKRTFVETINGVEQGCVFRFSQGFNAGVTRIAWGPDDALYVGQIGVAGNWGQTGKAQFGLQRMEFTGAPTFEMLAVRAKTNGFEIEFTQPLADDAFVDEPTHYALQQWHYTPTETYGGPKQDIVDLNVKSVTVSADRKRVFLETEGQKPGSVVYFRLSDGIHSGDDKALWSTEAWYTLNEVPKDDVVKPGEQRQHNVLTDAEKSAGWKLLFDGKSFDGWKGFQSDKVPAGWKVVDGEIHRGDGGGDLVTGEEYGDFELSLDWKIAPGGNSGIIWRASEAQNPGWLTGPEMQILDNKRHADGRNATTSAGSVYALIAPPRDVSLTPNRWNTARLVARGTKIEYWLNNVQTASFDTASDEWKSLLAKSKFRNLKDFAKLSKGRIILQDHSDPVSFRNVKIRKLD